uniref:Laminin subunit alpha n=1 Tax=Rhabditophanes sp. KR3021 TaxID=114890 RepID=A0AC35TUM0_9BILA
MNKSVVCLLLGVLLLFDGIRGKEFLEPPLFNLAKHKNIVATSTCGEYFGKPYKEMFCSLASSLQYTPVSQYSSQTSDGNPFREARAEHSFVESGHSCDYCYANSTYEHPPSKMVDGTNSWWQSPPLSRGSLYEKVNITINLGQEFHIAYIYIVMANSPRPATWALERSTDYGKTFKPWQYFAEHNADCARHFGFNSLAPITADDSIICSSEYSKLQPMDNGEIYVNLLENRPGRHNFSEAPILQEFARATNVRLRLLSVSTLHGNLIDLHRRNDPTVTRRYFYAIKEIKIGGTCACNGHAKTCDYLDPIRPETLLCRCLHGTCGTSCETCCPGFEQKKWQISKNGKPFECEPCNCHGHSHICVYDEELNKKGMSLDINGKYEGGGRCLNCLHNTKGINCNECVDGYFKPAGYSMNQTNACKACECDPTKHNGNCAEGTECQCLPQFVGENCDQCAPGYYDDGNKNCLICPCNYKGTEGELCLPEGDKCPCKENFSGQFCDMCAPGRFNLTGGCLACDCHTSGSATGECDLESGHCLCKNNFSGDHCTSCEKGYFNYPQCQSCNCDISGSDESLCDPEGGQCLCKVGYAGDHCDKNDEGYYGYPNSKACECDANGSNSTQCDLSSGACPCLENFSGKQCDKCAAGFYDFPNCLACNCFEKGSKGNTCDKSGNCYCKPNFQGKMCGTCNNNFFNFPICEECNCDPDGVSKDFGGCDTVAEGELCECKKNVIGRTCNQCKPTFWDLKKTNEDGCIECSCDITGTLSGLNSCQIKNGQCQCKQNAAGRRCEKCLDGFFNKTDANHMGCEACNCSVGGSVGPTCAAETGACRCKPRVTGLKCDKPIDKHYFPTPWHMQYEAEEGKTPDNKAIRYAIDENIFANYSWKGFAVFSPIQDEIHLTIDILKNSVYKILFHYQNPTDVENTVQISLAPYSNSNQVSTEQTFQTIIRPTIVPTSNFITPENKPLPLNHGRYIMKIKTKKRLYLDYVVFVPAEYYEGFLERNVENACLKNQKIDEYCLKYEYQKIDDSYKIETPGKLNTVNVKEGGEFVVVVSYQYDKPEIMPVAVKVSSSNATGNINFIHCPYAIACRELVTVDGLQTIYNVDSGQVQITLDYIPQKDLSIKSIQVIPKHTWSDELLKQHFVCIQVNNTCVGQRYPDAQGGIVTQVEELEGSKIIEGHKLPFDISNKDNIKVAALDSSQGTIEISGVVDKPGHYGILVDYYNPRGTKKELKVLVHTNAEQDKEASVEFDFCPAQSGCRATIKFDKNYIYIEDKYSLTIIGDNDQKDSIYLNSITTVPLQQFVSALMKLQPLEVSQQFASECSKMNFKNDPNDVTDFCRDKIFSLTTDFNRFTLPCECNPSGSSSFSCAEYGGQCGCKENIMGRKCDKCKPGYFNFPACQKCKCGTNEQCNEQTGQCFCPPHIEGTDCSRCVKHAYGFDPLIGCELCGCHRDGSERGELECDSVSGQCKCKDNVGSLTCTTCLPGFFDFPRCNKCACSETGTTENICNSETSECLCKDNVVGKKCDQCKVGTFDLTENNPNGCSNCFCFGTTDSCKSSLLKVYYMEFDNHGWSSTDDKGEVIGSNGEIVYSAKNDDYIKDVFLKVPLTGNPDYTMAYGHSISYSVKCQSNDKRFNPVADIRLIGKHGLLEAWSIEQPDDPTVSFSLNFKLLADNWSNQNGEKATRAQLMMVLVHLKSIEIKVSYLENIREGTIADFKMEKASNENLPYLTTDKESSSVEVCECPPSYTGHSCQTCAPGHYRIQNGEYLGSCVPCECNNHSGDCSEFSEATHEYINNGICLNCEHNTMGDHCEICDEGFYGNATSGTEYSCLSCPCPYRQDSVNFAIGCDVQSNGLAEKCYCRPGYTGETCDRCDAGFYGNPIHIGGKCDPCFCNNNNNITDLGACNPTTGFCDACQNHTEGKYCELCEDWYFGDAIDAKNCTACDCDQNGSEECDKTTGTCKCLENVEGERCDRCIADSFGIESGEGCTLCNCGGASLNSQCDAETGQCPCLNGVTGQQCQFCEHGYWNYTSANGCQKCDCEADLSKGTVCDTKTGACSCQEGSTGMRCDQCIPHYLRVPELGCRECDNCVFSLKDNLDVMDSRLSTVSETIKSTPPAARIGGRLIRIEKAHTQFEPVITIISDFKDTDTFEASIQNMKDLKQNSSTIKLKSEMTFNLLGQYIEDFKILIKDTEDLKHNATAFKRKVQSIIGEIKSIPKLFEQKKSIENREVLIRGSTNLLNMIKNDDKFNEQVELSKEKNQMIKNKRENLIEKTKQHKLFRENVLHLQYDVTNSISTAREQLAHLTNISFTIKSVHSGLEKNNLFKINSAISSLKEDSLEVPKLVEKVNLQIKETKEILKSLDQLASQLVDLKTTLQSSLENLKSKNSKLARLRRNIDENSVNKYATDLEAQAKQITVEFAPTKQFSGNAVEAANIYKNITAIIQEAEKISISSLEMCEKAAEQSDGIIDDARDAKQGADTLKNDVTKIHKVVAVDMENENISLESKLNEINKSGAELLENINKNVGKNNEFNEKFDDIIRKVTDSISTLEPLEAKINDTAKSVQNILKETTDFANEISKMNQEVKGTRAQLNELETITDPSIKKFEMFEEKSKDFTANLNVAKEKLANLREKIEIARNMANRIKLGAKFERGSSLELDIKNKVRDVAVLSDISFYLKTRSDSGLILYLGNSGQSESVEYLAVKLINGKPVVHINLGSDPNDLMLDTQVNDNRWRYYQINRLGKVLNVTVSEPESLKDSEHKTFIFKSDKHMLNLDPSRSKLLLGSAGDNVIPVKLASNEFVGSIEEFTINNVFTGLWSNKKQVLISGAGKRKLFEGELNNNEGVSFNGNGYIAISQSDWNVTKTTEFSLLFQTYVSNGLIFFTGKERDYLMVRIEDGYVKMSYDLGSGVVEINSNNNRYDDGQWHTIRVNRVDKKARLVVNDKDQNDGEAPGAMVELKYDKLYYLGDVTYTVKSKYSVTPFKGCIKNFKVNNDFVDFKKASSSKGVQMSCPAQIVRTASFVSPKSLIKFSNIDLNNQIELSLMYKTVQSKLTLATIKSLENSLELKIDNGEIDINIGGQSYLKAEYMSSSDGNWHIASLFINSRSIKLFMDDQLLIEESNSNLIKNKFADSDLIIGTNDAECNPKYCIADLILNQKLMNFAQAITTDVKLHECVTVTAKESCVSTWRPFTTTPFGEASTDPFDKTTSVITTTTQATVTKDDDIFDLPTETPAPETEVLAVPRSPDECALKREVTEVVGDQSGIRFGVEANSRIEFSKTSESFDKNSVFSVKIKPTSNNGLIMFVTNTKHSSYMALYLNRGYVYFAFDSGFEKLVLKSNRTIIDDRWHTIRAERENGAGSLVVDNDPVVTGKTFEAIDSIIVQAPIYFGGVSNELISYVSSILSNTKRGPNDMAVKTDFSGCMTDFKLNENKFNDAPEEFGVKPCSVVEEEGMYYGDKGGYSILNSEFKLGGNINLDFEIRPRTDSAVLLYSGVVDYLFLELHNGSLKFEINLDNKPQAISINFDSSNYICDGNWHNVKLWKIKNVVTVTVDGLVVPTIDVN